MVHSNFIVMGWGRETFEHKYVWMCSCSSSTHDRNQWLSNWFHWSYVLDLHGRLVLGPVMFYKYVGTKHVIKHRVTPADHIKKNRTNQKFVIVAWRLPPSILCEIMWLPSFDIGEANVMRVWKNTGTVTNICVLVLLWQWHGCENRLFWVLWSNSEGMRWG